MAYPGSNPQKLAEKLIILNDHAVGITTRIYNIKKACADPNSKPSFLSDRSLDGAVKYIVKRFPVTDVRSGSGQIQALQSIKLDIIKALQLYYSTFVDLLELKDHIVELLTTIDACGLHLDIAVNPDLTIYYLDLVARYVSLMILLSRIDDRKTVLGLYNTAYELQNGASEPSFPRLGTMIMSYEQPLRQLSDEFTTHSKVLSMALSSVTPYYMRRNLLASEWRNAQMLSLVSKPTDILFAAQTSTMICEYISLEKIDRWIILCLTVCHGLLATDNVFASLWQKALQNQLCTQLFRDECIQTHAYIQQFFESIKGYNKRVTEMKEFYNVALQQAPRIRGDRRRFLRTAVKELILFYTDQPGLLGPKVLFVWMALSFTRDEIMWLARHVENWPTATQSKSGHTKLPDDLNEEQLPELMFYMEELRSLVTKYSLVIKRYHVQYLCGYDAIVLNECMRSLRNLPEDEAFIMSSICNTISDLDADQLTDGSVQPFDFSGIRMDWCRLQSYLSVSNKQGGHFMLHENSKIAHHLNTLIFHTKMVDWLDSIIVECGDLSLFCFQKSLFDAYFSRGLTNSQVVQYLISFPLVTAHFPTVLHNLCPEENNPIRDRAWAMCSKFLEDLSVEAKSKLTQLADEYCKMSDKLLPKQCARLIEIEKDMESKKDKTKSKKDKSEVNNILQLEIPGNESMRKSFLNMTNADKFTVALRNMCTAINYRETINVFQCTFAPREFFTQHLETRFNKTLSSMVMYEPEPTNRQIAKPSELLSSVRSFMNVLQSVGHYVSIDIARIFNTVLLVQTQALDRYGEETITTKYTKWYLEELLRKVSTNLIVYSPHRKSFLTQSGVDTGVHFNPQEYCDVFELRALSELLGPYGVKFMIERLTWHVGSHYQELKKMVVHNKDILREMRTNFDKTDRFRELHKSLVGLPNSQSKSNAPNDVCDNLLQRLAIIGEILSFRDLLLDALREVLSNRVPFLISSVEDFSQTFFQEHDANSHPESIAIFEMFQASGFTIPVDATLVAAIKTQKAQAQASKAVPESAEDDYQYSCLLMVFIAVCLPRLAHNPNAAYKASIAAHSNNAHCIPKGVNELAGALFQIHSKGDIAQRMQEFLAIASGCLLRFVHDTSDVHSSQSVVSIQQQIRQTPSLESTYLLLDKLVDNSSWLTQDILESCFPYVLLRSAYHLAYKKESVK